MYNTTILIPLFLLLIFASCSTFNQNKLATTGQQQSLKAAIIAFNTAFKEGDVAQLAESITVNYQHTNGNAKAIGKETWLNYLKKRTQEIDAGNLVVTNYEMQETQIEYFGTTAIVTAKIRVTNNKNGTLQDNEYRVTNIWVLEKNQWKRAGFHDGKIR